MSQPQLYGKLVLPIDDAASNPSIQMGGSINQPSGTGLRGDSTGATFSVAGVDVLQITSAGIVVGGVRVFTSSAGTGGSATEVMTLTGIKSTDTILSVSQKTPGGNSLPLLGFSTLINDHLTAIWSADPGAGAVIIVTVKR